MRYIRYAFLGAMLLALVLIALANRQTVELALLPEQLAGFFPVSINLPLFVVVMLSVLAGLMAGYVLEYFREHKHRAEASRKRREAAKLAGVVNALKQQSGIEEDDVLA
ncbi:MAG TPA: LapA family protein [Paracoccaceae bacterium]|nr:LapA family protein [Paracoccaceae bacterium]